MVSPMRASRARRVAQPVGVLLPEQQRSGLSAVLARSDADFALEHVRKMTRTGIADVEAHLDHRLGGLAEKAARPVDAQSDEVSGRGEAGSLLERPAEVELAQPGSACQGLQAELLAQVLFE